MINRIKYNDRPPGNESIGELEVVEDFLPAPEQLLLKRDGSKTGRLHKRVRSTVINGKSRGRTRHMNK